MTKDDKCVNEDNQQIYTEEQIKKMKERQPRVHPDKKQSIIDYERITDYLKEGQAIKKETGIAQKEATWIPQTDYPNLPFATLLASDIHYGSLGVDYDLLERHLSIVESTPNFFIATNGDHIDNFSPTVLPSGMLENPLTPQLQTQAFMNRLLEMDRHSKIAWLGAGNHDDWISAAGYDYYQSFMRNLTAPIFDVGGKINIITRGAKYRGVFAHTYWGKSKLNITNAPKRLIEHEAAGEADFGWLGHTHQSSYEHFTKAGREYLAIVSGSYKREDNWAAKKGISLGAGLPGIAVMFWPDRKHMEVFKDIEVAQQFMTGLIFEEERRQGNVIVIDKRR